MTDRRITWHLECDADWRALAPADAEAILAQTLRDGFHSKQGRSIARWRLGDNLSVYLKRHYRESRIMGLLAAITGQPGWSSAWQEYHHLKWAQAQGIRVPRPVAAGESAGPGLRLRGFLAVEDLIGMSALHELVPRAFATMADRPFLLWKRGLIHELARMTRELHSRRYFHKDLYLCHFFAPEWSLVNNPKSWRNEVAMIDLHRLSRHCLTWKWWQLKDLAQLAYSSEIAGVTPRDRLRFWRLYAGVDRRRMAAGLVKRLILVRWRNYRDHNLPRLAA